MRDDDAALGEDIGPIGGLVISRWAISVADWCSYVRFFVERHELFCLLIRVYLFFSVR